MLRYYAYYSVGGYKDMFLGASDSRSENTYYFPLLPVWKKRVETNNDTTLEEKILILETLPKIEILNDRSMFDFPENAKIMFSHGGYKVLYTHLSPNEYILAIRDIEGEAKDEEGRSIPFSIVIAGSSIEDRSILDRLSAYVASNLTTTCKIISAQFVYDAEKNGLCFHLENFNNWISRSIATSSGVVNSISRDYKIDAQKNEVALLIIPEGLTLGFAVKEQNLQEKKAIGIAINDVIPHDDQKKLLSIVKRMIQAQGSGIITNKTIWCLIGGVALIGFFLGYISGRN